MFGKSEKNQKPKKGLKIIIGVICALLVGVILICIFAGDDNRNKALFPSLGDYVAEYIDYYDEKETDEYVIVWYLIDEDDLPELDKYKKGIVKDYDFESVDGGDDDYYFRYTGEEVIFPLTAEKNQQEYHVRIGVGDEKIDGKSLISFMYAAGLEDSVADNEDDEDNKDEESKDDNKDTDSGKDEVLVESMSFGNKGGQTPSKDSVNFQSLFDFADNKISFDKAKQSGMTFSQAFEGGEDAVELIDEYTKLLCKSGMNFKEEDSIFEDYRNATTSMTWNDLKIYASWSLDYTGTASVDDSCDYDAFGKSGNCAVYVYYAMNGTKVKGYIEWSADLESTDLGFRCGGQVASSAPSGQSVGAGLIRTADGKYKTSDGRFSVGLNEGVFSVGGNTQKGAAEFTDYETASDLVKIKDADGRDTFVVFLSNVDTAKTGLVYNKADLGQEYQHVLDSDPGGAYNYGSPRVYQRVKDSWLTPGLENNSSCQDASLRIVYYNKEEKVAVFYIYTDLKGGSEAFCAVDLSQAASDQNSGSGGSGGSASVGSGYDAGIYTTKAKNCTYCGNTGYVTCSSCGGKGYYVIRGSAPNYAGSLSGGKTYEEIKDCEGLRCVGGKKPCLHCNY